MLTVMAGRTPNKRLGGRQKNRLLSGGCAVFVKGRSKGLASGANGSTKTGCRLAGIRTFS
jgi:hypothetical protein